MKFQKGSLLFTHIPPIFTNALSLTNLIVKVHVEDCADADRRKANDAVFDPQSVSLERHEEADLGPRCLVEVALGKLEDGEEDDGDGPKDREENPIELVEKPKVGAAFDNKATFSVSNQHCPMGAILTYLRKLLLKRRQYREGWLDEPEEHAEEEGVEEDSDDNRS